MVRYFGSLVAISLLTGVSGFADDGADRDKLLGSWVETGNGAASTWTFAKSGDSFQIKELQGSSTEAGYSCKADGAQCEIKVGGKKATVSMWFNGPKLVQMETQGSSVVKRRFAVLSSGDTMELEIIPLSPGGKTETIQFKRATLSAQGK